MPLVVAMSEIPANKVNQRGSTAPGAPGALSTTFFRATRDTPDAPTASLNRYEGGESRYSAAHFHEVDQFQIIMEGSGEFGRHPCRALLRPFRARLHALRAFAVGQGHGMGFHRAALALRFRCATLPGVSGETEADT